MDTNAVPLMELHERHARLARIGNKSEKTIAWHRGALEDFCRYLERQEGVPAPATLRDFTLEHVRDYILHLRQRPTFVGHPYKEPGPPLSDASINCYVRGLRAFASWLYEQEYTETNLLGRLKAPKMTQKAVEILSDEEVTRVLTALKTTTATSMASSWACAGRMSTLRGGSSRCA
jgi:site-specific recombinase XerD